MIAEGTPYTTRPKAVNTNVLGRNRRAGVSGASYQTIISAAHNAPRRTVPRTIHTVVPITPFPVTARGPKTTPDTIAPGRPTSASGPRPSARICGNRPVEISPPTSPSATNKGVSSPTTYAPTAVAMQIPAANTPPHTRATQSHPRPTSVPVRPIWTVVPARTTCGNGPVHHQGSRMSLHSSASL